MAAIRSCPQRLFPCLPASKGLVWGFTFETLMMIIADRYSDSDPAYTMPNFIPSKNM